MPSTAPIISNDETQPYQILKINFDSNVFGVIILELGLSGQKQPLTLYLSQVCDPLDGMVQWLEQLAANQLPAVWEIRSEAPTHPHTYLHASPLSGDRVELRITNHAKAQPNAPALLQGVFRRKQVVRDFLKDFKTFLRERYLPQHWQTNLRELDLSRIKPLLDRKPG